MLSHLIRRLKKDRIEENPDISSRIVAQQKIKEALELAHLDLEKRVEQCTRELHESHAQLLHVEKLATVGNLSASIAHEFNNSLQSVLTILQRKRSYASLDQNEEKLIGIAIQECIRMRSLISGLSDFYRPTSGAREPVDLHAVL